MGVENRAMDQGRCKLVFFKAGVSWSSFFLDWGMLYQVVLPSGGGFGATAELKDIVLCVLGLCLKAALLFLVCPSLVSASPPFPD